MFGALFAAALAAAPANAPASPAPAPAAQAKPADPLVCHMESIEGSRITHKVCQRASDAARQRQDARRMAGEMQGTYAPSAPMMGPMH